MNMKIQLFSDLHIEFGELSIDISGSDIVILAGDIHVRERGVKWILQNIKNVPVLYVLGNHEFYGETHPKLISKLKEQCKGTHIHILEHDIFSINGIHFLGCTLWTDFGLFGHPGRAGYRCQQAMTDFRKIRKFPTYSKIKPSDVMAMHHQSKQWLQTELERCRGKTHIVITHHAPSVESLHGYHDEISSAYASDLTDLIKNYQPSYWIHGHLHHSSDYWIGKCRVLCNPKGYPDEINDKFNPRLSIEV